MANHSLFCSLALVLLTSGLALGWDWYTTKTYSCSREEKLCKLTQVSLENDGDIERATFEGLHDPLVIESGRIPRFTAALAEKLTTVSDLKLDGLSIVKLYVRADFSDLSAIGNEIDELLLDDSGDEPFSMLSLKLSQNKLTSLPPLERFTKLYFLELDHNQLTTVDMAAFSKLTALRELSLAHNRLHTVTSTVQLYRLKVISFAGNELVMLNMTAWEMESLEGLSLADNSLTRVEGNLTQFSALKKLTLAGNRLHCGWLMAEPLLIARNPKLQIDADNADRCEAENMMRYLDHCCTHSGKKAFGLLDVYQEKWDQLERLTQLIGTLNASIANGSVQVKGELDRQHGELSKRLDELQRKEESHTEQLKTLEQRMGNHRDTLDTMETDLFARVNNLRAELDAKWNETVSKADANGTSSNETLPSASWSREAAKHETTLGMLRKDLETARGQFNLYMAKCYDQRPRLESQSKRLDAIQKDLDRTRELHRDLKEKYGAMDNKLNAVYDFYKQKTFTVSDEALDMSDV
uniref:Leucine rich immune protein (Short) n=1 Tax=Anopheles atroparvus TaxID=41427 RepID=A0A8W7MY18_ANOAO